MWVKICGTTNLEDAEIAMEAGADALGFVFAPGPRQVTAVEAGRIASRLPAEIERVGVFVNASLAEISEVVMKACLTGVQLHVCEDHDLPAQLRERFRGFKGFRLLQVLHLSTENQSSFPEISEQFPCADAVLVEARSPAAHGGTGSRFNWKAARESFLQAGRRDKLIVAGGLSPENVAEAIHTLLPWGVDVVTGVERELGRKSREKVCAFVREARAAARVSSGQKQKSSSTSS